MLKMLTSSEVLSQSYHSNLVGAVLSHYADGTERPIAYASKILSASEKKYAMIERKG